MAVARYAIIDKRGMVVNTPTHDNEKDADNWPPEGYEARALPADSQVFPGYQWDGKNYNAPSDFEEEPPTFVPSLSRNEKILRDLAEAKTWADGRAALLEYFGS